MSTVVEITDLQYAYDSEESLNFPNVSLAENEHLLILGASGVGKTTLLHLLSGLLPAKRGKIVLGGTEITALSRAQLDNFRAKNIGLIFQKYHFVSSLNVEENLKLRQQYPNKSIDNERRVAIANRLGLGDLLKRKVSALSQGQQQRLSIALGLIHQPSIVLADEPTSNLDDHNCDTVIKLLKEEASLAKSSLIIITHDSRVKQHFSNQIEL